MKMAVIGLLESKKLAWIANEPTSFRNDLFVLCQSEPLSDHSTDRRDIGAMPGRAARCHRGDRDHEQRKHDGAVPIAKPHNP